MGLSSPLATIALSSIDGGFIPNILFGVVWTILIFNLPKLSDCRIINLENNIYRFSYSQHTRACWKAPGNSQGTKVHRLSKILSWKWGYFFNIIPFVVHTLLLSVLHPIGFEFIFVRHHLREILHWHDKVLWKLGFQAFIL